MAEGFAMLLKPSSVSDGLLIFGSTEIDLSQSFPSSLIRPGVSSSAGAAGGCGCCCGEDAGGGGLGTDCCEGDCTPSVGGAACGQAVSAATRNASAAPAMPLHRI